MKELQKRVVSEVERLVELHRGECIAMFSHATPARALGCHWLKRPTEEMARIPWVPNASVSVVEYDDHGEFRVVLYAHDRHQGNESTGLPKGQV